MVSHLRTEYVLKLRVHVQLEVRRQDLDRFELLFRLRNPTQLYARQEEDVQAYHDKGETSSNDCQVRNCVRLWVPKGDRRYCLPFVIETPLDIQSVLAHENLAD